MSNVIKMEDYLSIGELAKLTGIGVHTLRVWERRYGAPHSQRLPSGHRRYPKDEVPRLKAIAKALESGYRASKVVTGTLEELQGLLGAQSFINPKSAHTDLEHDLDSSELIIDQWIGAIHRYNDELLSQSFYDTWNKVGPLNFILDYSAPFIERIGNGWKLGELTVGQEHFVTSQLNDFLSSKWRQLNIRKDHPVAVLSTLPGETHSLGLLMCAVVTSLADFKVIYLGHNSPVEDIIKTTEICGAQLLCLSISICADITSDHLSQIRRLLSKQVDIVVGGEGASNSAPGITKIDDFSEYHDWLRQFKEQKQ